RSLVTIEITVNLTIELRVGIASRATVAIALDVGHPLHPDAPVARRFGGCQRRQPGPLPSERRHLPVVVRNSISRYIGRWVPQSRTQRQAVHPGNIGRGRHSKRYRADSPAFEWGGQILALVGQSPEPDRARREIARALGSVVEVREKVGV